MSIYGVWPQSKNSVFIMLVGFFLLMFGFQALAQQHVNDNFDGTGALIGYTTNNPKSLEKVGRVDGRYRALIDIGDNESNITLHFNSRQGRLDAKRVRFPFEYIARNIGIGAKENSQVAPAGSGSRFIFAGIQVHDIDLNLRNSSHIVVGHRGGTQFTLEGKSTVNGRSRVNDLGSGVASSGRADLRIVGNVDNTLTVFWQRPNLSPGTVSDNWTLYRGAGNLPTPEPVYGDEVYIGLITYAQGSRGLPFVGTSDAIEFTDLSSPEIPRNPPTEEDDTQPPGTPAEGNIEIILDNGDSGTSSTGRWLNASAASLHYGRMSLYGRVGSGVDSYRFTPTIVTAGEYDVYEWNSCYSPRASDVPHEIVYAGGRTTIDVNQDCSSGVTGEWNHLGTFPFSAGNSGYVEISDNGITDTSGRYLGADAVRFVMTTE
ncbi:MAG: hypothetical protein GXP14_10695 [Gammaproteobacteria bacterium]|nr:hypothetical protein [Gammaproteobacteria bacterium]